MSRPRCKGAPVADRIRAWVVVNDAGCWEWQGAKNDKGYGRMQIDKRTWYSHRASYEAFVGPIPEGLQLDHLCRNPGCCNPGHLEAVTPSVNVRRGDSPGAKALRRTHCLRGHAYAEHGVTSQGRRKCRACSVEYLRAYQARRRDERAAYWAALGIGQAPADVA